MTATLPPTMAACFLLEKGRLELRDLPTPTAQDNQVLVRVASVGICGSDLHFFREGRVGIEVISSPLVLGHECSGTIVAVGAGVDANRIGSRVSLEPQHPCRHCRECKKGLYNLCPEVQFFGAPPTGGALSEYVLLDSDFAHSIDDRISDDAAALIEPFSIGISAVRKGKMRGGDRVLIAGAGPIGVLAMLAAKACGAGQVVMTDPFAERREMAIDAGAAAAFHPAELDQQLRFDLFIDCSGNEGAVLAGMAALVAGGTAVLVGVGADVLGIDPDLIRRREITVTGVFRSANCWPDIIELLKSGVVNLDALVSKRFALKDFAAAFGAAGSPHVMKIIVDVAQQSWFRR